jgi:hypothetical protein
MGEAMLAAVTSVAECDPGQVGCGLAAQCDPVQVLYAPVQAE